MKKTKMSFSTNCIEVNRDLFLETLMKNLIEAKNKFPDLYNWPDSDIFLVFRNLVESLESDTYSRHIHAIQWTIKDLKLGNDRKTINTIFKQKVG